MQVIILDLKQQAIAIIEDNEHLLMFISRVDIQMWLSLPDIDISSAEIIIFFDVVEVFCETRTG